MALFKFSLLIALLLALHQINSSDAFLSPSSSSLISKGHSTTRIPSRHAAFVRGKEKKQDSLKRDEKKGKRRKQTTSKQKSAYMVNTRGMPELKLKGKKQVEDITKEEREMALSLAGVELSLEQLLLPLGSSILAIALYLTASSTGIGLDDVSSTIQAFREDPTGTLQTSLDGLGPYGIIYFGCLYVVAELLAIPATPLTLSAGYLFGLSQGVAVVLIAGTISAMIGFYIGKTFLRFYVERLLEENPKFKKLDSAIGAEGFKLLLLIRLSPIFPFALLNYTYGASSIQFPTFVAGTLLGFAPSTFGYVYTGLVGKELLLGEGSQPWYVYASGLAVLFGFLKLVTDVATEVVEAIDSDE